MGAWSALVLATPVFGLTLTPPELGGGGPQGVGLGRAPGLVAIPAEDGGGSDAAGDRPSGESDDGGDGADTDETSSSADEEQQDWGQLMARRQEVAGLHKPLGIATWASMTVTMVLGGIQYHNLYGFFEGEGSNPCVQGDAVFGQGQCTGTPWLHLTSAMMTTALYGATFVASLVMPAPDGLDEGDGEYAKQLRTHKLLRWVHLGGMAAQLLLGVVIANGARFGLDRANDYKALQALSTLHLATGLVTYGALTWAGALMVF